MTTHEALALQPSTLVNWIPPKLADAQSFTGVANLKPNAYVRVIWDEIGEPDSIVHTSDRRMLAAIEILQPKTEQEL